MLIIEFEKQKYSLPESWSEVTFAQLKQLMKLDEEDLGQLEKAARTVAILSRVSYDKLVDESPSLVFMLLHRLDFLEETIEDAEPVMHFKVGNDTYFVNDLEGATFREYADYQTIDAVFTERPEEGISRKLAVLCRKHQESPLKNTKAIEDRAGIFDQLDAETVLRINSFFLLKRKLLKEVFLQYSQLEKQVKEKEERLRELMTANGAGGRLRTRWQNMLLTWSLSIIRRLPMSWRI